MKNNNNLVDLITTEFEKAGHSKPNEWKEDSNVKIAMGACSPVFQRLYVNRYFRQQLGNMQCDTALPRLCLDDSTPLPEYIKFFKKQVIPVILANQT